jgi:hypothetical protein
MSRQAATPAATLSAVMLKNIDNQTIDGEEKSKPEVTPEIARQQPESLPLTALLH